MPKAVASLSCVLPVSELAAALAHALPDRGVVCSDISAVGTGATFMATIDSQNILVLIGPRTDQPGTSVITVGRAEQPLARLVGLSREASRQRLGEAIDSALRSRDDIVGLQWFTDDAWAVVGPTPAEKPRPWWRPGS